MRDILKSFLIPLTLLVTGTGLYIQLLVAKTIQDKSSSKIEKNKTLDEIDNFGIYLKMTIGTGIVGILMTVLIIVLFRHC